MKMELKMPTKDGMALKTSAQIYAFPQKDNKWFKTITETQNNYERSNKTTPKTIPQRCKLNKSRGKETENNNNYISDI